MSLIATIGDPMLMATMSTGLDEREAREINAVVGILEGLAVALAARFDAARIDELRAANERFRLSAGDPRAIAVADHDLHRRLVEACDDERLLDTLAPVRRSLLRWQSAAGLDDAEVVVAASEHDAIIDALASGDHHGAAQRLREHVAAGLPALLAVLS
jgi:DNA-binding GntR family transcriptional regulator